MIGTHEPKSQFTEKDDEVAMRAISAAQDRKRKEMTQGG